MTVTQELELQELFSTVQPDICLQADELMSLLPDDALPLHTTPGRVRGVPVSCLRSLCSAPTWLVLMTTTHLQSLGSDTHSCEWHEHSPRHRRVLPALGQVSQQDLFQMQVCRSFVHLPA